MIWRGSNRYYKGNNTYLKKHIFSWEDRFTNGKLS